MLKPEFMSDESDPSVREWQRIMAARAHGHDLSADEADVARLEFAFNRGLTAAMSKPIGPDPVNVPDVGEALSRQLDGIHDLMMGRHAKYGPGNIAEFGPLGILVRMADKFARLKAGQSNFDDETVANTLDDVIGYALIWKLWLNGEWPGSVS